MKHVPDQLQVFRNEKKYFEATELLKNSGKLQFTYMLCIMAQSIVIK